MAENQTQVNTSEQLPSNAKLFSILAYISVLWLLGLLITPEKNSPYVRHHVNNGIVVCIMDCIPVVCVFAWVCMVMGIIAAAKTQYFTLPLFLGKIKIVK